ncbi:hypothetical protein M0R45_018585 [Rubus argutus]|uniref:Integrator complex subunit 7 n=1 Tax=Rubus argutus TaxID=59490 RepID=A0AAW1X314_RUBAR
MERNSAACVMEWSIELEKALRSKKPGRSLEAISEIGLKLQRLSREPECSPVIYHMFDLIPGEDKLFYNAIILRLANAFESGDKHTRLCILKAFLFEYHKRNKRKEYRGVLSKTEAHVQVECLGRVKVVFDSEDVEDRALALGLFGCWANFAKESSSIRYLVLSSIVSSHILEVKASLFAAGCFAELSEDFARVVLEMLLHMMNSPETLPSIRLAGARLLAKTGFSHSIANNAYKTGRKLLLDCSDKDYQVAMLVSLSKLASRSTILISEHVDLLLLFLNKEKTVHLQGTALRCLHYIFHKGMYHLPLSTSLVNTLFSMLDEPQLPSPMLFQALQTLHKMLLRMLPYLPFDVFQSSKLLSIAGSASPSPITSESLLAISVLVNISRRLKGSTEMESLVHSDSLLPSQVILLIIDRITLMVKPVLDLCQIDSVVFQQVNVLFNLLILLIQEYPDLHVLVLDQIFVLIKSISVMHDIVMATTEADGSVHDNADLKTQKSSVIRSMLVLSIYRFLVTFLENLSEAGAITTKVFDKVKILVKHVCQSNLFECYTYTIYSLLLQHKIIWGHLVNESEGSCNFDRNSDISLLSCSVELESHVIEFAKRMLTESNSWPAYRVGTYAACHGAWHTATFIFEQLVRKVHSDSCYFWLKSLVQYAHGEWKCELLPIAKTRGQKSFMVEYFISLQKLTQISLQLKRVALEFDLVTTSFIDIDKKSSDIISVLAISCSLLAFCSGFALYIPNLTDPVSGFSGLKNKSNRVHNEEGLSQVTKDGLQLLLDILMKWMQIPFRAPKYFFKLRPCLGSELFAVNEAGNRDGIFVSLGSHLSLNLCLQLRNVPSPDIPVRFNKWYCMLYCKVSFLEPRVSGENKEQELGTYQAWETDDMVEMNEKLLKYATQCSRRKSNKCGRGSDDGELVISFVCFKLNDTGQGFSSCLLDVSGFPVGCYRIKWHSCCIDSQGECWTLPPLNLGPVFTIQSV